MFHAKNGWYFQRTVDGGVDIQVKSSSQEHAPIIASCHLNHLEWASVIASVSYRGEISKSFDDAIIFHDHRPGTASAPLPKFDNEEEDGKRCEGCGQQLSEYETTKTCRNCAR